MGLAIFAVPERRWRLAWFGPHAGCMRAEHVDGRVR